MHDFRWPLDQDDANYRLLFEGLIEQSVAGIYLLQNTHLVYVNEAFARMCGVPREKLIGRPLARVAPPQQRESLLQQYERRLTGGDKDATFMVHVQRPDGQPVAIEIHGRLIDFRGQPAVIGVGIDATLRLRRQEELQQSRAALSELVSHIESVREAERQRIAMELHDAVGGMLSALKFDMSRLARHIDRTLGGPGQDERRAQLEGVVGECLGLVQDTIATVRQISEDLHPSALPHLGLAAAIANHLRQFEARYGIACRYAGETGELGLDMEAMGHLYRIFQESMTNVAKHAQASEVQVRLGRDAATLVLSVRDNGVGLSGDDRRPGAYGLLGMRERARRLGGTLSVGAAPEGGTVLTVEIPAPGG
ncbi:PAS domain-containing sensor histidine kinase [Bordetella bronchiseptica]|uniref:PAS domain-containing sensor histidine kinase n=1 Tax=Bordetella bronchiseptica TaxID=518 RepID=UPI00404A57E4